MSGLGPDARALIERARSVENATPADRERVRQRLSGLLSASGVMLSASAARAVTRSGPVNGSVAAGAAGAAGPSTAVLGLKALWVQATLWGSAALVAGAGVWVLAAPPEAVPLGRSQVAAGAPLASPAATSVQAPAAAAEAERALIPTPISALPQEPVSAPSPAAAPHGRVARTGAQRTASPSLSLTDEARELSAVRAALRQGHAAAALGRLDALDLQRGGALQEERLAARILSLCALERPEAAHSAALEFRALAPHSPLLPRLLTSCARSALQ